MTATNPYLLWAKLPKEKNGSRSFHPLICHMLDVAVVAREMWRNLLPEAARRRVTESLQLPESEAETWITYIAALHDLGKASPAFQLRKEAKNLFKIYEELGKPSNIEANDCPHGRVTAGELPEILINEFEIDTDTANRISVIIGGHHGTFPTSHELMNRYPDAGVGVGAKWKQIRLELALTLKEVLGVSKDAIPHGCDHSASMYIAGLVSVADWIGSSDFFPYLVEDFDMLPTKPLADYLSEAESKSQKALARLGWMGWGQPSEKLSFKQLFDFIPTPRPLQQAAIDLADKLPSPGIVIVEAPMGEGKTEAALYLADRWGVMPGPRGCYVALPTQATSNQMFTRVRDFLAKRYPADNVNFQLLHGHAALSSEFKILREHGDKAFSLEGIDECGTDGTSVVAAEWFTHRKRGLLAPFGVGTIDQALLAVLQTRHVFVRLFGLAHKVIIVDEVHAYDAYMSKLLERLLEWLAALGSPVVLLSATLPDNKRIALLKAYLRGINRELSTEEAQQLNANYPRISWASAGQQGAQTIEVSNRIRRTLKIEWIDDTVPLGQRLKDALADGGCAAVICNTVNRAQQTYQELKSYFSEEELDLFHARFLFKDRNQREKQALADFGKEEKEGETIKFDDGEEREVRRPPCKVLVATQVIEQSLDLDFDLMVTDCAPVDLILQRSGRLHRHERGRLPKLSEPVLWIRQPESVEDSVPTFDRGTEAVYAPHVLLRSWLSLRERSEIEIPGEIETLVESVYSEQDCPASTTDILREHWQKTAAALREELKQMQAEAQRVVLPEPTHPDDILDASSKRLEEDEPEIHKSLQALTRLTEPNVSVICLTPEQRQNFRLSQAPTISTAKELLGYSVTLSNRGVVWTLLEQKLHSAWAKSALLKRYRLLEFDDAGCCLVGNYQLQVHPELGVTINKLEKEQ